jgi:hypothetical protein
MTFPSKAMRPTVLGVILAVAFVAGCGTATSTPAPTRSTVPAVSTAPTASGSAVVSGSAAAPGSASPCDSSGLGLAHVDAALEDLLPSTIGGVCLEKFSLVLSAYVKSPPTGGDKSLYAAWLVKFGKTPDDVNLAITADLAQPPTINFNIHAIKVPGVAAATLSSTFGEVARAANWSVASHPNYVAGQTILEITDPATGHVGYVYSKGEVLYAIITDDQSLLTETVIWLSVH